MGMMKVNSKTHAVCENTLSDVKKTKKSFGEKLTRNILVAALLLCCVIGARDMSLPGDQSVIDVLQTAVKSEWDENLGRLVYVNGTVSDAIAVFSSDRHSLLYQPSKGELSDVFSKGSPHIVYANAGTVCAAAEGEVISVTPNTADNTYCIRVQSKNTMECLYYGLQTCFVSEGEEISAMAALGDCGSGSLIFEVRRHGECVDASALFAQHMQQ